MEEVIEKRRKLIEMAEELTRLRKESEELSAKVRERKARKRELGFLRAMYRKIERENKKYYEKASAELGLRDVEDIVAFLEKKDVSQPYLH
jgi:hypothetical protein